VSSFALSDKERDALMEQVYGGYTRSPLMTRGNKATGGADRRHKNAGKIDYFAYGGKVASDYNDGIAKLLYDKSGGSMPRHYRAQGENWRNRDTWQKVAKHLGIKKVDSESDLREMYDFVSGYKREESKPDDTPKTETDYTLKPRGTRVPYGNKPMADQPRTGSSSGRPAAEDGSMAAIRGGDDLNEWYQTKFVPHLEADANATNSEIGDDSRYFLKNFVFEPPKLGSIKDLFDKYKGEIEGLD